MLKILCCVKQVPDVDQMRMDPETGNLIRAGVPAILNPQDANALSAAMSVKETYGGEVTLITMGPPNAEAALRECLAVASCDTIVCVGNGVKDESLPKYKELAKLLGGKLAGTRPVCDRELLPVKLQVGQSGVMIKPKLYIGFGVSGAVNHVTGVDAEKFIAVNKDASAPIFNYCDYGIVGDMDEVCDAMIAMLKN